MRQWSFDEYFINEAYLAARKSKDPSSQIGAVIVGPDNEIRAKGYNGPPRGFNDDDPTIYQYPLKSAIFSHAEENCIACCARIGTAAKNCVMYVTFHPCCNCARLIVQCGIKEVVLHKEYPQIPRWIESITIAKRIFDECGVTVREWSGLPVINEIMCSGVVHQFA